MFSYQVFDGKFTQRELCQSPSKFFHKVFDAGLHDQRTLLKKTLTYFFMENFERVNKHVEDISTFFHWVLIKYFSYSDHNF